EQARKHKGRGIAIAETLDAYRGLFGSHETTVLRENLTAPVVVARSHSTRRNAAARACGHRFDGYGTNAVQAIPRLRSSAPNRVHSSTGAVTAPSSERPIPISLRSRMCVFAAGNV